MSERTGAYERGERGWLQDCDAVFNLELPTDAATYAHRAGRTGRFGRPGLMVSVVEPQEAFVIQKFEKLLGIEIPEAVIQGGEMKILSEMIEAEAEAEAEAGGEGDVAEEGDQSAQS